MCGSSEWLDIVWSLCVLGQANLQHYESVLNSDFLNRIDGLYYFIDFDFFLFQLHSMKKFSEVSVSRSLKILNINAAARLLVPNYKGANFN